MVSLILAVVTIAAFFYVVFDVFRRTDLSMLARVGWIAFSLIFPLIGFAAYLWVRSKMPQHVA